MAIIQIGLSEQLSNLVLKANQMSETIGDIDSLTTGDTSLVGGLNAIRELISPFDDSSEIISIGREAFSVTNASGFGDIAYDSDTGVITLTGASQANIRSVFSGDSSIGYNSTTGVFSLNTNAIDGSKLLDSSLTFSKFKDLVILNIKNSSGTILKTVYSPGS